MMADARRGEFSVVLVAAFDRIARSTKNFLEDVDELREPGIEFVSAREAIDTRFAKKYGVSRASVVRFVRDAQPRQTVAAA
jgi:hypothetical protein